MGDNSAISWTDATWNPIRSVATGTKGMVLWGCERVSPGCDNCYASTLHSNHGGAPYLKEGSMFVSRVANAADGPLQLHEPTLTQPLRWAKPRRIVVCSMTDLFGDWVPDTWLVKVFGIMDTARQHQFQVLTKRTKRMRDFACRWADSYGVLPNVWMGTSIESQAFAWRLNYLAETPAIVRFVSAEPLLGPLELRGQALFPDWVIVGGESGPRYRPMRTEWATDLREQCQDAGSAFFFKQSSGLRPGKGTLLDGREWHEFPLAT